MTFETALITGHTGLKGSWLSLFLSQQGTKVNGFSDRVHGQSHYELAKLADIFEAENWGDITDPSAVSTALQASKSSTIFHFAAQSLVIEAAKHPQDTFDVNLGGTWNVLRAFSQSESADHLIIATTDKVYGSKTATKGFMESDPLSGTEPYSQSKVLADLLSSQYPLPLGKRVTVARAGNVVGGGDHNLSRLVPEVVYKSKSGISLRRPEARRPWQHALDVANAYQAIGINYDSPSSIFNIGPSETVGLTALEVAEIGLRVLGETAEVRVDEKADYSFETGDLRLDSSKIAKEIGWSPILDQTESITKAFEWHSRVRKGESARAVSLDQIDFFMRSF